MSLRVVVSLASFLFFAGFTAAQSAQISSKPECGISWSWSWNRIGQDPCTVAAYLISTCNNGSYTLGPLNGKGDSYVPAGPGMVGNGCMCNTVMYALLSACDGCQGCQWPSYSEYTKRCRSVSTPGSFPQVVPSGTYVPNWVLVFLPNVTDRIDLEKASMNEVGLNDNQTADAGPGAKIG